MNHYKPIWYSKNLQIFSMSYRKKHGRPPGLRGKEIGMYYKSLHAEKMKNTDRSWINLSVPPAVFSNIYRNLQSIENIAQKLNIQIPSLKKIEFSNVQFNFNDISQSETSHNNLKSTETEEKRIKLEVLDETTDDKADSVNYSGLESIKERLKNRSQHITSPASSSKWDDFTYKNNLIAVPTTSTVDSGTKENQNKVMHTNIIQGDGESSHDNVTSTETKEKRIKLEVLDETTDDKADSVNYGGLESIKERLKNRSQHITSAASSSKCDDFTYKNNLIAVPTTSTVDSGTKENQNEVMHTNIIQGGGDSSHDNLTSTETKEKRIKLEVLDETTDDKADSVNYGGLESIKERLKNRSQHITSAASSSKCDDFTYKNNLITTPTISTVDSGTKENQNKVMHTNIIQGGGDFKYSYEDIITGTFDEKLEECLSNGMLLSLNDKEANDLSLCLYEDYIDMTTRPKYMKFMEFRENLPTYKKSAEILKTINNNQVVVISGETGCGKSTQVPQLLLDDSILNNRGANVKILVTQPRRIAASSLAIRVSEERGEEIGQSVGYAIRLEKVDCRPRGSIVFCTTGILLTELEVNQGLTEYSHVILDEVHERDTHIDLSMCMLKKVLQKRKDLKLILMSATIDSESLSSYFDNCPMLHIEGIAYPVQDIYLEDILMMTKYKLPEDDNLKNQKKVKPWHRNRIGKFEANEMEKDIQYKAKIGQWLESIKEKLDKEVYKTLQDYRIEDMRIDLIFELLIKLCSGNPGAILVFLPGISDITKLLRMMVESSFFPSHHYQIYPLHSKLPSLEQNNIFQRPPEHIRKIVIATNIAETSITIDDVVYVIDSGRMKYNGLNVEQDVSTLKSEWISKANLKQRRGRAGRCQPGICYHLFTSFQAEQLEERLLPEMQRNDLLEPVLAIKKLRLGRAVGAMNMMPAVPAEKTIESAVRRLQQCGALDSEERLTPLGWHLARLPVPPCAGKLLVLGALFGCLDRAASVAAVWGFKDPFQLVIGKEREVDHAKQRFARGEPSDHIAISEAIIQWELCPNERKRSFAYENFLSSNTLQLLSEMKNQFGDNLKQMGFLSSRNVRSHWENRNANNLSLFKAIVAASLYPNIGTVRWRTRGRNRNKFVIRTPEEGTAIAVHPSSVLPKPSQPYVYVTPGANWLVYWMKQRSTNLFLFEITFVHTLPLLFFGELNIKPAENSDDCLINIKSINVTCNRETAALLFRMRALLDQVLASKITKSKYSGTEHSEFEEQVLETVVKLITAEDEGAEYLDDDDY